MFFGHFSSEETAKIIYSGIFFGESLRAILVRVLGVEALLGDPFDLANGASKGGLWGFLQGFSGILSRLVSVERASK